MPWMATARRNVALLLVAFCCSIQLFGEKLIFFGLMCFCDFSAYYARKEKIMLFWQTYNVTVFVLL